MYNRRKANYIESNTFPLLLNSACDAFILCKMSQYILENLGIFMPGVSIIYWNVYILFNQHVYLIMIINAWKNICMFSFMFSYIQEKMGFVDLRINSSKFNKLTKILWRLQARKSNQIKTINYYITIFIINFMMSFINLYKLCFETCFQ